MKSRKIINILYIFIYVFFIAYITILSRSPALTRSVRSIPLWSYLDLLKGNWLRIPSIGLNIILFVPLGYLLAEIFPQRRQLLPLFLCFAFTVAIEIIQYVTYLGYTDIDDIISNVVGGVLGTLLYWKCKNARLTKYAPAICLIAGLVGCLITSRNVQHYETQFGFEVTRITALDKRFELEGICTVYNRDRLPYQILLAGENETQRAETSINGSSFTAIFDDIDGELLVQFKGYQPLSTSIYLNDENIGYVPPQTPEPEIVGTDLIDLLENSTLMLYSSDYDVYVYQDGNRLYWLVGRDFDASIIYHLFTEDSENLPVERQKYGFDNRGFKPGSENELTEKLNCGKYRVFTDIIPDSYSIMAIAVGLNKGTNVLWKEYFRPLR